MADAPNTATYLLVNQDTTDLPESRTLVGVNGITFADSGPGESFTASPYGNLLSIFNYDRTGFMAYNATGNIFSPVSFTGGTTISITNADGVGGTTTALGAI